MGIGYRLEPLTHASATGRRIGLCQLATSRIIGTLTLLGVENAYTQYIGTLRLRSFVKLQMCLSRRFLPTSMASARRY
jgi:hypothetical protein